LQRKSEIRNLHLPQRIVFLNQAYLRTSGKIAEVVLAFVPLNSIVQGYFFRLHLKECEDNECLILNGKQYNEIVIWTDEIGRLLTNVVG
jgi:hypothetical protein